MQPPSSCGAEVNVTLAVPEGGGHPLRAVTPPFYHRFTPVTSQFPKEGDILFVPLHRRFITVSRPLHRSYLRRRRSSSCRYTAVSSPFHARYIAVSEGGGDPLRAAHGDGVASLARGGHRAGVRGRADGQHGVAHDRAGGDLQSLMA